MHLLKKFFTNLMVELLITVIIAVGGMVYFKPITAYITSFGAPKPAPVAATPVAPVAVAPEPQVPVVAPKHRVHVAAARPTKEHKVRITHTRSEPPQSTSVPVHNEENDDKAIIRAMAREGN